MSLLMAVSPLMALSPLTAPSLLTALFPLTAVLPSAAAPSPVPDLCQGIAGDTAVLGFGGICCCSHMQSVGRRGMFKGG